jgi:hypothetical protein
VRGGAGPNGGGRSSLQLRTCAGACSKMEGLSNDNGADSNCFPAPLSNGTGKFSVDRIAEPSRETVEPAGSSRPRIGWPAVRAFADVLPAWLVLALATTVPYLIADLRTPQGTVFTGVLTAQDDTFSYLAWMKQAARGHVLMRDLFTSEPQTARFFLPLWVVLGWTSRQTGLSLAVVFHIARLLAAFLILLAAWSVGRCVMKSRTRLRFLVWMVGFSAGLGWVVFAAGDLYNVLAGKAGVHGYKMGTTPVDINMPEATVFRSAFCQVHMTLGAALICGTLVLVISAILKLNQRYALYAGLLASLLAVVHPYEVVVTGTVATGLFAAALMATPAGAAPLASRSAPRVAVVRLGLVFLLANLPGLSYLLYLRRVDSVLQEWLSTMSTLSPNPVQYLLGFGILIALAIGGAALLWQGRGLAGKLLLIWAVIQGLLLYAPFSFQRRLVEGLQVPLCVAAASAVFWLLRKVHVRPPRFLSRRVMLAGVILATSMTSIGFIIGAAAGLGEPDPRRYLDRDLVDSLKWLGANADPDSVLLSSYMTGNVTPALSGLGVFLGHYDQTLHSRQKGEEVAAFYSGRLIGEHARALFANNHLSFCLYGPFERELNPNFSAPAFLEIIYRSPHVDIYKVKAER